MKHSRIPHSQSLVISVQYLIQQQTSNNKNNKQQTTTTTNCSLKLKMGFCMYSNRYIRVSYRGRAPWDPPFHPFESPPLRTKMIQRYSPERVYHTMSKDKKIAHLLQVRTSHVMSSVLLPSMHSEGMLLLVLLQFR